MHVILSCGPNEALFSFSTLGLFCLNKHSLRLASYILQHEKFLLSIFMRGESQYEYSVHRPHD